MAMQHEFLGPQGLDTKVRTIAGRCKAATEGMPRTLVMAATLPDSETTPDCEQSLPRAFWINRIDSQATAKSIAELLGSLLAIIEMIEHDYTMEFGESFRDQLDEARVSGHAARPNIVPTEPTEARPWPRDAARAR